MAATKSTDPVGALDHRLRRRSQIAGSRVNAHLRRLVLTAWDLGAEAALADLRSRVWAHALGYRGHWATKRPTYSTSFAALRVARSEWRGAPLGDHDERHGDWRYASRGYSDSSDLSASWKD